MDSFGHPVPLYGPVEFRCTQDETGDAYSAMGSFPGFPGSYTVAQLNQLGWNVGTATISAVVPDVMSETIPSATSEITAAGLVRGVVRTTINCEDINRVVSQSPVAGVHLPPGGTVDLTQGVPPPGGCGTPQ